MISASLLVSNTNEYDELQRKRIVTRQILKLVIMVLIMSSIMSFVILFFNVYFGMCSRVPECFVPNFFNIWLGSFLLAFAFGVPIVLIAAPSARKIVGRIERLDRIGNKSNI